MSGFDRLPGLRASQEKRPALPCPLGARPGGERKKRLLPLVFILVIGLLLPLGAAPSPEEMEIPVETQVPLFLKILTFDRNLKKRVGDEIVLGIVYQEKFRTSLNVKNEVEQYLKGSIETRIDDIPFRWVCIPLSSVRDLKTTLGKTRVDIVYISPLRAVDVESLAAITRSLGIASMTGVPEYCRLGIAISIGSKGGSPVININLSAAQAEGIDFSSRLLKLAKVINEPK
jgi:hypothetical protein